MRKAQTQFALAFRVTHRVTQRPTAPKKALKRHASNARALERLGAQLTWASGQTVARGVPWGLPQIRNEVVRNFTLMGATSSDLDEEAMLLNQRSKKILAMLRNQRFKIILAPPRVAQIWSKPGQIWSNSGRCQSKSGRVVETGPNLAESRKSLRIPRKSCNSLSDSLARKLRRCVRGLAPIEAFQEQTANETRDSPIGPTLAAFGPSAALVESGPRV